jgi:hypothetical protein
MSDKKHSARTTSEQRPAASRPPRDTRPVTPPATDNPAASEPKSIPRRPLAVEVRFLNETAAWW